MELSSFHLLAVLIAGYFFWRFIKFRIARSNIPRLLSEGALVVDVRTSHEFAAGSRPGSLNIPLSELPKKIHILDKNKPIVVCCASGARSGAAQTILKKHGFRNVLNAGPWQNTVVS